MQRFGRISASQEIILSRLDPGAFVGRAWLADEIAHLRDDPARRRLVIVGEPGSGKSAFVAYLAETWNCPRHFIRVDNIGGATGLDPRSFLVSMGAQLCEKYGPDLFEVSDTGTTQVTVGWSKDRAEVVGRFIDEVHTLPFLPRAKREVRVKVAAASGQSRVIGESIKRIVDVTLALDELTLLHVAFLDPLHRLQKIHPKERVVALIDALDEGLQQPGKRIIDVLPSAADSDFPANLRLVMTSRRGDHLVHFQKDELLYLDDQEKGYFRASQDDVCLYVDRRLSQTPLAEAVSSWKPEEIASYRDFLAKNSAGNFLYLYYYFKQAAEVVSSGAGLQSMIIPKGLDEIYRVFAVEKIKANTGLHDWVELYLPLLGTLAVVREPVDRHQLAGFAGVPVDYVDFILTQLNQFLDIVESDRGKLFRFYHLSFSEYLLDSRRNRDYPLDAPVYHAKIAAYYRFGFQTLADVQWNSIEEKYPFNHLSAHLDEARLYKDLFTLINRTWWQARYKSDNHTYGGLLADVERAWETALGKGKGRATRSTLIRLKTEQLLIGQQVSSLSDLDLQALAWLQRGPEALAHARLRNSALDRISGLMVVFNALNQKGQPDFTLLEEAETAAASLQNAPDRSSALDELIKTLVAAGRLDQAAMHARSIPDARRQGQAFRSLVRASSAANRLEDAIQFAQSIQDPWHRAHALRELAVSPLVTEHKQAYSLLQEAETAAHTIEEVGDRSGHLALVSIELCRFGLYDEALGLANSIPVAWRRAQALGGIAAALWNAGKATAAETFAAAVKLANEIQDQEDQASALRALVGILIDLGRLDKAWELIRTIPDQRTRDSLGWVLEDLVIALCNQRQLEKAKEVGKSIEDKWSRDNASFIIAISMIQAGGYDDALKIAQTIESERNQAVVKNLAELAIGLDPLKNERASAIFEQVIDAAQLTVSGIVSREKKQSATEHLGKLAALLDTMKDPRAGAILDKAIETAQWILADFSPSRENVMAGLAVILAQAGLHERAYVWAQKITDDAGRSEGLKRLSIELARLGVPEAGEVYEEARQLSEALIDPEDWTEAISGIARALCQVRHFDEAYTLIHLMRATYTQRDLLIHLAEALTKAGQFAKARPILEDIEEDWKRAEGLGRLAACLAAAGDRRAHQAIREAVEAALAVTTEIHWIAARVLVADAFAQAGLLDEVLELANAEQPPEKSGERLVLSMSAIKLAAEERERFARAWVVGLLRAGRKSEAYRFAHEIEAPEVKAVALCTLAVHLVEAEDDRTSRVIGEAVELIQSLAGEERDATLSEFAFNLINIGAYPLATNVVQAIEASEERALALSRLAMAQARAGDAELDRTILEVMQSAQQYGEVLGNVVTAFVTAGKMDEALEISRSISESSIKEAVLARLATARIQVNGALDECLILIGTPRPSAFVRTLSEWAPTLESWETGLSIALLGDATEVAGWSNSNWGKIRQALAAVKNGSSDSN